MPEENPRVTINVKQGAFIPCEGGCGHGINISASSEQLSIDKLVFTCSECSGIKSKYEPPTKRTANPRRLDAAQTKLTEQKKK